MPYFDRRREPDDYEDAYHAPLPRRPRPAVTNTSSYDSSSPRRDSRRPHWSRRNSAYRDESKYTRAKPPGPADPVSRRDESRARDTDYDDRRRDRARPKRQRDPEREARKARRLERAAQDPEYAARRQQRRASRRADRRVSRQVSQYQDARSPAEEPQDDTASSGDEGQAGQPLDQAPDQQVRDASPPSSLDEKDDYREDSDRREPSPHKNEPARHPQYHKRSIPQDELDYREYRKDRNRTSHRHSTGPRPRPLTRGDSWQSYGDDWTVDLENSSMEEKRQYHSSSTSAFSELDFYKRYTMPSRRNDYEDERRCCCGLGRKCCVISFVVFLVLILAVVVPVAVVASKNNFSYTPSTAQVNETAAFTSGAATRDSVNNTKDGIGGGQDVYTNYKGNATKMLAELPVAKWVSFEDMWNNNLDTLQNSCGWLDYGENDSTEEIQDIYNAIQDRANASLVDHRLVLAFVLQESKGCVRVPNTKSSGGVKNTGLMQAHNGHEYTKKHQQASIVAMIQDGVQGTKKGNGIVQELNAYSGNPYAAARAYNSGYIPSSGDLSEAAGATACYVSDIANRLTGWVKAKSTCSDSGH
ncbi:hypothetical protein HII31_12663 [Pseudocercospora fuligena]|uniref:Transglycosylase SLT domain-containing protein n=1 Tax=Pseudocercospora fuligena TaxID=685502 RepID=A0A8H6R677_9PEZI|nr:hypothetical protein HII31_12663 [Pseudocercospora fuligena]